MVKEKQLIKKRKRSEEGQAMVEFALVLPLLLLIICGILDFGWLFYNQSNLDNATREAAREICVEVVSSSNASEIKDTATLLIQRNIHNKDFLPDSGVVISYYDSRGNKLNEASYKNAKMVRVTTKINMPVLTVVLHTIVQGDTKVLSSSATFMVETGEQTADTTT